MSIEIKPGIIINAQELSDEDYNGLACILLAHGGGNDFAYPRRAYLLVDGDGDVNAADIYVKGDPAAILKSGGQLYGAEPYWADAKAILAQEGHAF